MPHTSRSRRANGTLFRKLRIDRNLSQHGLAKLVGYSERVVRKAEGGECLDVATLRNFADVFSSEEVRYTIDDLCTSDEVAVSDLAREFINAYCDYGRGLVPYVDHLLAENFEFSCPGVLSVEPYSGLWVGERGLQDWLDLFFGMFEQFWISDEPRFTESKSLVSAHFEEQLLFQGCKMEPIWVNLHFHFLDGKISKIDREHNSMVLVESIRNSNASR